MMPLLFHSKLVRRLFLAALKNLRVGEITLVTPEKETWHFVGQEPGPLADLTLYNWDVIHRLFFNGERALARDYKEGKWDSETIPALLTLLAKHEDLFQHTRFMQWRKKRIGRKPVRAQEEVGADFYKILLGETMAHSSALYEGETRTLEQAHAAKYERILNHIAPAKRILEIGCGWGDFMQAATKKGYSVRGLNLARLQAAYITNHFPNLEVAFQDYREEHEVFDAIVSIEMFETIGEHFWPIYFISLKRLLKKTGKAMVQTVFTAEDMFPSGALPTQAHFLTEAEKAGLQIISVYRFGQDYAQTIRQWLDNLESQSSTLRNLGYSEPVLRSWRFYLGLSIRNFLTRRTDVAQVELTHA
jgi:cyclopropane-fatty-acyl-phospholipid synthase